ncbi:MAG: hypothetical protein R2862_07140 [Thermoanaerobaculia bacterium]
MSEPITLSSQTSPKKGMSTLVKVLLGCGVLLLLESAAASWSPATS